MKIYEIESNEPLTCRDTYEKFRFRSLYNDCVGRWCVTKKVAEEEGEKHQAIIQAIYSLSFNDIKTEKLLVWQHLKK